MDYKDDKFNLKYFNGKDWPILAGGILAVIGAIPLVLALMDFYILMIPGVAIIITGAAMLMITLGGRTNEAGLEDQIERISKPMLPTALGKLNLEDRHVKVIPLHDPHSFGEFDFTGDEEILIKCGRDGKYRSSMYSRTLMLFTRNTLCCYNLRFSFIDNKYRTEQLKTFKYVDIDTAYITYGEYEYQRKEGLAKIKYACINIKGLDGEIFTSVAHNDADLDKLVEDINVLSGKYKKQAEESNQQ